MTDYAWSDLRTIAIRRFKDVPTATQEQRIIDVFMLRPELVATAIDHVAERYDAGSVQNPWPFLAAHVEKGATVTADARASDSSQRDRAVQKAEQWIKTAGVHFDRESEVLEELYSPGGFISGMHGSITLAPWAGDDLLRERLAALWREHRPRGELVEVEAERRAAEQVLIRKRLEAEAVARKAELANATTEGGPR